MFRRVAAVETKILGAVLVSFYALELRRVELGGIAAISTLNSPKMGTPWTSVDPWTWQLQEELNEKPKLDETKIKQSALSQKLDETKTTKQSALNDAAFLLSRPLGT